MLDLATSMERDSKITAIETNHGITLKAPGWPGDTDFELVAFSPSSKTCEVIRAAELASDIARALVELDKAAAWEGQKPDWYRRLEKCADGASFAYDAGGSDSVPVDGDSGLA
jgi:hypothetical protein